MKFSGVALVSALSVAAVASPIAVESREAEQNAAPASYLRSTGEALGWKVIKKDPEAVNYRDLGFKINKREAEAEAVNYRDLSFKINKREAEADD